MHGDIRYIKIVQDMKRQRIITTYSEEESFFFIQHLSWRLKRRSLRRSSSSFFIWSCSVADFDYF